MEQGSVVKISDNKDNTIEKFSNIDAEIALIGCLLWDNRNFEKISDFLDEIHFVDQNNQIIYKQIKELLNKNILVSPITLKNYLPEKEFGVEITKYLNEVKDSSPSTQNTFQYAKIIYELHLKRSLVGIGQNIIQETFDNGSENTGESLIEIAENDLYNLSNTGSAERKYSKFGDSLKEAVNIINEAFKREGKIAGVASGLRDLDNKLGGLHKSDLIIIAGRPSMGKTALGTNIAFNVAKNFKEKIDEFGSKTLVDGGKVVFFSLEMSSEQLATRILAEQTRVSGDKMRKAELSKEDFKKIAKASSDLEDLNLFIDDNPILTIATLRARARRLQRLYGIDLIIIDYLQLMSGSNRNKNEGRVQEISEITRGLKAIAKELNIPIIALSQLSRQVEQREDKRPQLSDLRESGTIEQDSDVVMFIFRESYYLERMEPIKKLEESDEKHNERTSRWQELCEKAHNTAEVIIAKQRHGPIGTIKTHFESSYTRFSNLNVKDYDNIME
ncbi:MAG: replicative DNA helicase [Pelagibacteraceae bacterium]|nr:replicative DNA helicase [Pelagibacteraceae bacterium]MBT3901784.1 replicative DNA helicase [Pelagibacteraceae bacterium]MBT4645283.1 replicative DNA helicase [Pelagibacteraceae bacterium]MBT4950251.1 replicative DNA helicase [Pelagibacteraceae bacterium]